MSKFFKFLFALTAIFAVQACTDLEEDLVGDITDDIVVEGVDTGTGGGDGGV